jgi:hypothetical protein
MWKEGIIHKKLDPLEAEVKGSTRKRNWINKREREMGSRSKNYERERIQEKIVGSAKERNSIH